METGSAPAGDMAIEQMKKEKLLLKDQIYVILRKASVA
ncbi:YdcH family protein [Dyella terrae]|nr:YdcH family protein [Dyella terrae]